MDDGFEQSVEKVRRQLQNPEQFDGFLFSAGRSDELTATQGMNPTEGEVDLTALLGIQLLSISNTMEIHPAVLAHGAAQWALDQQASDDPKFIERHD